MILEILIHANMSSDKGTVHYRQAGDQHPFCSQRRADWEIIKLRDRMVDYADYNICLECGERKRKLEFCTIG